MRSAKHLILTLVLAVSLPLGAMAAYTPPADNLTYGSLTHGGLKRTYGIYVPERIKQAKTKVPLVIMLHGGGGYASNAAKMTGLTPKAEKEGFIVVYPEGTGGVGDILFTWNAIHCCGSAMEKKVDDVGFINTLIDTLVKTYPVDPRRVYVTGLSNGGMLTHLVGGALSHKVAAIAPVISGLRGDEPRPKGAVPTLIINGALDTSIPAAGGLQGETGTKYDDDTMLKPGTFQGEWWAAANRCVKTPAEKLIPISPVYTTRVWTYRCPAGKDVTRYLVGDNGHAWPSGQRGSPSGDIPGTSMNATDVIWDFFKTKSK